MFDGSIPWLSDLSFLSSSFPLPRPLERDRAKRHGRLQFGAFGRDRGSHQGSGGAHRPWCRAERARDKQKVYAGGPGDDRGERGGGAAAKVGQGERERMAVPSWAGDRCIS